MTSVGSLSLALPDAAASGEKIKFARLCRLLAEDSTRASTLDFAHEDWIRAARLGALYKQPVLAAASRTAIDLVDQGWTVTVNRGSAEFEPPSRHGNQDEEKSRVRAQELLRRDEQLGRASVVRFIHRMERVRSHGSQLVSVFDLMRDGKELADSLDLDPTGRQVVQPYVQIVDDSNCEHTGFRLHDIWRYFRHTWSSAYATVPGRSMPVLVRDAATPHHAVIGLAAISSPVVQIAERDRWIGWDTDEFVSSVASSPTDEIAAWVVRRVGAQIDEIYVDDLLRSGVLQPNDIAKPTDDVVQRLRADAERFRQRHHRSSSIREVRRIERESWVERAETDLFRSKRSAALAEALELQSGLGSVLGSAPTATSLGTALEDRRARAQFRRLVRRARGERVGTVIADLTVCGAVAPYSNLAAGKLVGALAVSPTVLAAYRKKYSRPSEIASAMAGRAITRESRLSFVSTSSLYGSGSSQYNRLFWPASVVGGPAELRMGFHELGKSRSFGTSHFTDDTVAALLRLSSLRDESVRVNSLFGEGVSPRLRKVRLGLAALGWPADVLLQHGRERILYGVPLVDNLRDYSLGISSTPAYIPDVSLVDGDSQIGRWWLDRWAIRRSHQPLVREAMMKHRLTRPMAHGARVTLPKSADADP